MKNTNQTIRTIVEVGLFGAIGYVLDEIQGVFSVSFSGGGSIGFAMIAVLIIAYRRGLLPAILTGLLMGLLDMTSKAYILHPVQVLCDYVLPYMLVGLGAGLFAIPFDLNGDKKKNILFLILGTVVGGLLKFASHYIAGVIWWGDPEYFAWNLNYMSPYLYSFVYNIAFVGPSIVMCGALLVILYLKAPIIFDSKINNNKTKKEKNERKRLNWVISLSFIVVGAFLFIYYLIKYIDSYYYKASSQKYSFNGDYMTILLCGFVGLAFGIYCIIRTIKNDFDYHLINILFFFVNLAQFIYAMSRMEMHVEELDGVKIINSSISLKHLMWTLMALLFVIISIAVEVYYQFRIKKKNKEITSAN